MVSTIKSYLSKQIGMGTFRNHSGDMINTWTLVLLHMILEVVMHDETARICAMSIVHKHISRKEVRFVTLD